ncbi:hypothetical protein [Pontibacter pamirensis]|nr:hypothetical protein [Pontibacter pamirensis]
MYHEEDAAFYDLAGHEMKQLRVCTATMPLQGRGTEPKTSPGPD